jgi:catechol 2,3-dioxygenase-like lactoylglutathione lyase family enzyme
MTVSAVTLIVLRCADVERAREFYEALGLALVAEQHGDGPRHYSTTVGRTVLELYPRRGSETRGLRLGLSVSDLAAALCVVERFGGRVVRTEATQTPKTLRVAEVEAAIAAVTRALGKAWGTNHHLDPDRGACGDAHELRSLRTATATRQDEPEDGREGPTGREGYAPSSTWSRAPLGGVVRSAARDARFP